MTRTDLITRLASLHGIRNGEAEQALNTVLSEIGHALADGSRVELRGFGVFSKREREPRSARNPRTGETFLTPAKAGVHFKPGLEMQRLVNGDPVTKEALALRRGQQLRRRDARAGQFSLF